MTDDFMSEFRHDDKPEEEGPDWVQDIGEEDEFEQLRRRTARAGSTFDEMTADEDGTSMARSSAGVSFNDFTPGQRLALAILVLLNIIVIGLGFLAATGRIGL